MKEPGCTGFPEGDWHDVCVEHDKAYEDKSVPTWDFFARRKADLALYRGVRAKGHPMIATLMFVGVRMLGLPAWINDRA